MSGPAGRPFWERRERVVFGICPRNWRPGPSAGQYPETILCEQAKRHHGNFHSQGERPGAGGRSHADTSLLAQNCLALEYEVRRPLSSPVPIAITMRTTLCAKSLISQVTFHGMSRRTWSTAKRHRGARRIRCYGDYLLRTGGDRPVFAGHAVGQKVCRRGRAGAGHL